MGLDDRRFAELLDVRCDEPERIVAGPRERTRRASLTRRTGHDVHRRRRPHGARHGGPRRLTRWRCSTVARCSSASWSCSTNPRVDGVLASADIMDDLAAARRRSTDKVAVGTMNRGGLAGTSWSLTTGSPRTTRNILSRGTSMRARCCCGSTTTTPTRCRPCTRVARAVQELNDPDLLAMVEPIPYTTRRRGYGHLGQRPAHARACRRRVRRARRVVGTHVAQDPGHRGHRDGGRDDDPAAALLGGAPGPDPEVTFRGVGAGSGATDGPRDWWSVAPSSTRPTATSPASSTGPPPWWRTRPRPRGRS